MGHNIKVNLHNIRIRHYIKINVIYLFSVTTENKTKKYENTNQKNTILPDHYFIPPYEVPYASFSFFHQKTTSSATTTSYTTTSLAMAWFLIKKTCSFFTFLFTSIII